MTLSSEYVERGAVADTSPVNVIPTWGGVSTKFNTAIAWPGNSIIVKRRAQLVVASDLGATLTQQIAQNAATSSTLTLFEGSYLKATKIAD